MGIIIPHEEDLCLVGVRVVLTRLRGSSFGGIATVNAVQSGLHPLECAGTTRVWYYELKWSTGQSTWHQRHEFDLVAE